MVARTGGRAFRRDGRRRSSTGKSCRNLEPNRGFTLAWILRAKERPKSFGCRAKRTFCGGKFGTAAIRCARSSEALSPGSRGPQTSGRYGRLRTSARIHWTSGANDANSLSLKGGNRFRGRTSIRNENVDIADRADEGRAYNSQFA